MSEAQVRIQLSYKPSLFQPLVAHVVQLSAVNSSVTRFFFFSSLRIVCLSSASMARKGGYVFDIDILFFRDQCKFKCLSTVSMVCVTFCLESLRTSFQFLFQHFSDHANTLLTSIAPLHLKSGILLTLEIKGPLFYTSHLWFQNAGTLCKNI